MAKLLQFKIKKNETDFYFNNRLHKMHLEGDHAGVAICYSIEDPEDPYTRITVIRKNVKLNFLEKLLGIELEFKIKSHIEMIKKKCQKIEKNRQLAMSIQTRLA